MTPDLDIYRSANLLVKQHGEDAPTGARDEFLQTATVQNHKRLANHTTGPPPRLAMA